MFVYRCLLPRLALPFLFSSLIMPSLFSQYPVDTASPAVIDSLEQAASEIVTRPDTDIEAAGKPDIPDSLTPDSTADHFSAASGAIDSSSSDGQVPVILLAHESKQSGEKRFLYMQRFKAAVSVLRRIIPSPRLPHFARALFMHRHIPVMSVLAAALAVGVLLTWFLLRHRDSRRFLTTTRLSVVDKEVQRACAFIEKNYANPDLTVNIMCDILVTGPAFLEALFQRELGMSIENFIVQVRMNRARIHLAGHPDEPLDELAASAGYSDGEAFSKAFLKVTGVTVEDYRAHIPA
jgi:AraC-like DNA-binding protein